jgi:hypothetical protein
MNEYFEIQFRRKGKLLKVKRQLPNRSIELDEPDPIERRFSIGFAARDHITEYRMRRIRQLRGWASNEFRLKVSAEGGSLVVRGDDPEALPEGRYRLTIDLDEAKARPQNQIAELDENGFCEFPVDIETDDRGVDVDLDGCDGSIKRVLDASVIDGLAAIEWLEAADIRPTRKACVLNVLASLRARPVLAEPLIAHVLGLYWASSDRVYAHADLELLTQLEALAKHETRPFYREGRPTAEIHQRLLTSIPLGEQPLFSVDRLVCFRGDGSPSLQTVIAEPAPGHPFVYAEFDLDLGNALQDVVGFIVHMGELMDGKPTNHLDLRRTLTKTNAKTRDFIYYAIA